MNKLQKLITRKNLIMLASIPPFVLTQIVCSIRGPKAADKFEFTVIIGTIIFVAILISYLIANIISAI